VSYNNIKVLIETYYLNNYAFKSIFKFLKEGAVFFGLAHYMIEVFVT
jgi:hypothetical protein